MAPSRKKKFCQLTEANRQHKHMICTIEENSINLLDGLN